MTYGVLTTASLTVCIFFFFNDTATTEIYTLSLHDALPIFLDAQAAQVRHLGPLSGQLQRPGVVEVDDRLVLQGLAQDRKSTRLNSSHANISYAVFCLKKKKTRAHPHPVSTTTEPLTDALRR